MGFPGDIIRDLIPTISELTEGVQAEITHRAWTGEKETGKKEYANPVTLKCIISSKHRQVVSASGQLVTAVHTLTFLDPITPNGSPGRREPIDTRDMITLPDWFTYPIVDIGGVVDPETGMGFTNKVMLGRRG